MTKKCFKCGKQKMLDEFYKHKGMADGYLNKCKQCVRICVQSWYRKTIEKRIEYERQRFKDSTRKEKVAIYRRRRDKKYPEKQIARGKVNYNLKLGVVKKLACEECQNPKSQAHHLDYNKPLDIVWLCRKHHIIKHNMIPF